MLVRLVTRIGSNAPGASAQRARVFLRRAGDARAVAPGPFAGGTVVRVSGAGFAGSVGLRCYFGDGAASTWSAASWAGADALSCVAPPLPADVRAAAAAAGSDASRVKVRISANGLRTAADLSADALDFDYVPLPTVAGVAPASGPLDGGTRVAVSGTGRRGPGSPAASASTRIGSRDVPQRDARGVRLAARRACRDRRRHRDDQRLRFQRGGAQRRRAVPLHRPVAREPAEPVDGADRRRNCDPGVRRRVRGRCDSRAASALRASAAFVSATEIECTSPPSVDGTAGAVDVEVTVNGLDNSATSSRF